jgi:hypothetical protein
MGGIAPAQEPRIEKFETPKRVLDPKEPDSQTKLRAISPPSRITQTEYLALRPKIAAMSKRDSSPIAAQIVPAANLNKAGNVLSFGIGTPPPGGFVWYQNVVLQHSAKSSNAYSYVGAIGANGTRNGSSFHFEAPIQGAGSFLITFYVGGVGQLTVTSGNTIVGGAYSEQSPALAMPFPSTGKVNVVQEVTQPQAATVWARIDTQGHNFVVHGCDFVRVR